MTVLGRLLSDAAAFVGRKGEHAAGSPHLLHGVDVASFQQSPATWRTEAGAIDFAAVKFTEVRAGNSHYLNPFAAADWAYLHQQGKGRIAYFFGHPSAPASETVSYFAAALGQLEDGDGIALDLEITDGLSPAKVSAWARDVMARLEKQFDRKPLLYCNRSFAIDGYCAGLGSYPLWLADPSSPAGHPKVPKPWKSYAIHQWSWTPLDKDVAPFASLADLRRVIGKKQEAVVLKADGKTSLHDLVTPHKVSCMHALRLTLDEDGRWPDDLYGWGNSVLSGRKLGTTPLPKDTKIVIRKGS